MSHDYLNEYIRGLVWDDFTDEEKGIVEDFIKTHTIEELKSELRRVDEGFDGEGYHFLQCALKFKLEREQTNAVS